MEKQFLVVDTNTNLIYGTSLRPDPDAGPIIPQGNSRMDGSYEVPYDLEFTRKGRGDFENAYWIDGEVVWRIDIPIEELKTRKRAEITAARIAADSDKFTYQGKAIRTADKDMFDLLLTDGRISKCPAGEMPPNWLGGWKAIDNSYLALPTRADWDAFYIAMYDAGIDNFRHSQELKAQLEAATTVEEVAAIVW